MTKPSPPSRWCRFVDFYRGVSLFVMNTLLLSFVAAAAFWVVAERPRSRGRGILELDHVVEALYPGRTRPEVTALLDETWSRPVEYEPFTQFKERAYQGRYVRVDAAGFRNVKGQGPWPPSADFVNVFVFGGSTTFGYGIADEETVASFLQEALAGHGAKPVRAYNFGRAFYYSSQERILFQQLLVANAVPDFAVFIDGLNEFDTWEEAPRLSRALHAFVEQRAASLNNPLRSLFSGLDPRLRARGQYPPSTDEALAERLIDRYLRNKKMTRAVAAAAGVKTVFVWQPISVYRYDWNRHPLKGHGGAQPLPAVGARLMAARLQEPLGPDFVWAADIQDGVPDPLYVDSIHYAPNLSRALASVIASAIQERGDLR